MTNVKNALPLGFCTFWGRAPACLEWVVWPQDGFKMASRWLHDGFIMAQKWSQRGLRVAIKWSKMLQHGQS